LTQTIGGTGTGTYVQQPLTEPQLYFFDIKNAAPGDSFTLYLEKDNPPQGNTNANVLYGGLTFDAAPVPEPASALSLCLGAGLLGFVRRRSHRV
jgi:hypothetical protein